MHTDTPHSVPRTTPIEFGLAKRFDVLAVQDVPFTTEPATITGFLAPIGAR